MTENNIARRSKLRHLVRTTVLSIGRVNVPFRDPIAYRQIVFSRRFDVMFTQFTPWPNKLLYFSGISRRLPDSSSPGTPSVRYGLRQQRRGTRRECRIQVGC